jgi:predicted secreted protein
MIKKTAGVLALVCAVLLPAAALAQEPLVANAPAGVLSLNAEASAEVAQDVVHITLFYEQQADNAATLSTALNQKADEALRKAKGHPGITVQTGAFTIYPATDRDGNISAWRGRTELILESSDFAAASKLAGQLSSILQVGDVAFSLSPQAQRAAQEKLTGQAITSFRRQAQAATEAFGYGSYAIREVNVGHNGTAPRPMMMAARSMMAADAKAAPVPIEAGKTTVSVSVSGSVQMAH